MTLLLAVALIGLFVLWIIEIIQVRNNKLDADQLKAATESYIEAYDSLRGVVNVNAAGLRVLQAGVDRQEKQGAILSTLIDVHSEVLKITDLRSKLESEQIANVEIEIAEEDDKNEEPDSD